MERVVVGVGDRVKGGRVVGGLWCDLERLKAI